MRSAVRGKRARGLRVLTSGETRADEDREGEAERRESMSKGWSCGRGMGVRQTSRQLRPGARRALIVGHMGRGEQVRREVHSRHASYVRQEQDCKRWRMCCWLSARE
jgi:hypothetical protein